MVISHSLVLETTTGGAPTKTLRESMLALTGFYNREVYGIKLSAPPQVAVEKIAERTIRVAKLLQGLTTQNIARYGVEYVHGTAKVGSNRRVLVTSPGQEDQELLAKNILVAYGSRPFHPDNIPFEDPDVWDSDEFFSPGRQLPPRVGKCIQQGRRDVLSESQSLWIIYLNESDLNWIKNMCGVNLNKYAAKYNLR